MVSFLDMRRDPQAVMSGVGMLVLLTAVAFAVLDDVYVAGVELLAYFFVEVLFYLLECYRYLKICSSPNVPADASRMRRAMDEFLGLADTLDLEEFLEGWFMHTVKAADIKRDNMVEFIAYGFYSKRLDALTDEERREISEFMDRVARTFQVNEFAPGYNADAKFMGHTLEPIRTFHKPIIIYLFMELIGLANLVVLRCFGFRRLPAGSRGSRQNMSMFIRKGKDETKEPLVFIHGVGFGALPYVHFLRKVLAKTDRPCIVVEMRHVSMRFSLDHRSVSLETLANDIADQMQATGYQRGFFLSHSYGTFVVSKLLQLRPEAVDRVCLIDPVCCMTCYPKLTHNFVYRTCTSSHGRSHAPTLSLALRSLARSLVRSPGSYQGNPLASRKRFMDFVQLLFSRDLTIADTFCRHLNGMDVNVFAHDFPTSTTTTRKHLLVLSGQDPLVPAALVAKQFKGVDHVDVLYNDKHSHGDFLFDGKYLAYLVVEICSRLDS